MPPRKRNTEDILTLAEPVFSDQQWNDVREGISRFNKGRYWHAHVSWEAAWLEMGDGPEDDGEIFLRALIQLASGLHLKRRGRYTGAVSQLRKAKDKFSCVPPRYLGIDAAAMRMFADYSLRYFERDITCLIREV